METGGFPPSGTGSGEQRERTVAEAQSNGRATGNQVGHQPRAAGAVWNPLAA